MDQAKIDIFRQFSTEYAAKTTPALVEMDLGWYLGVNGQGQPGGPVFEKALAALYGVAFAMKMASKKAGRDYVVSKLEGLWHAPAEFELFTQAPKELWFWSLMIRTPDFIAQADLEAAKIQARAKGLDVDQVYLTLMDEGLCVQMLHVGPYDQEGPATMAMREFAEIKGKAVVGRHHEIYLSDPRRTAPEKLKTILRLPVM